MGRFIWFEKNGISEKETEKIIQEYIKKFKEKSVKKDYIHLSYPYSVNFKKDNYYLGISLQFGFGKLIKTPKGIENKKYKVNFKKVNEINNGKKYEYTIEEGYTGKEYYEQLKNECEKIIKETELLVKKEKNKSKLQDYNSNLTILKAFLEFAKTGIKYPKLIIHYD